MNYCCQCMFWEAESASDNADGRAICLKLTEETTVGGLKRLCIIRTTGDHSCEFYKPLTAEQLLA